MAEVATAPHTVIETEKSNAPSYASSVKSRSATSTPSKSSTLKSSTTVSVVQVGSSSSSSESVSRKENDIPGSPKSKPDGIPKIVVKKEPASPDPPTARRRPPKLDLNEDNTSDSASNPAPRTAGGNLATMRDVGMACLSPGFATQDPTMREQLQRSISVRDQQRSIIEARLHRQPKTAGHKGPEEPQSARGGQTPKRRPPPNGLSIVPPPHRAFANERVVQSAPLNQSFTGRHNPPPSHIQPQNAHQPQMNRLPPISDVFASDRLDPRSSRLVEPPGSSRHSFYPAPRPSPGAVSYSRPREHRSAEEALHHLSGGREDLLPRIIHYGGHQPPTPPSPPQANQSNIPPPSAGRRRGRAEFEEEHSSPPPGAKRQYGVRDSPEMKRAKKEEFLRLCERAWELFHS